MRPPTCVYTHLLIYSSTDLLIACGLFLGAYVSWGNCSTDMLGRGRSEVIGFKPLLLSDPPWDPTGKLMKVGEVALGERASL